MDKIRLRRLERQTQKLTRALEELYAALHSESNLRIDYAKIKKKWFKKKSVGKV